MVDRISSNKCLPCLYAGSKLSCIGNKRQVLNRHWVPAEAIACINAFSQGHG